MRKTDMNLKKARMYMKVFRGRRVKGKICNYSIVSKNKRYLKTEM